MCTCVDIYAHVCAFICVSIVLVCVCVVPECIYVGMCILYINVVCLCVHVWRCVFVCLHVLCLCEFACVRVGVQVCPGVHKGDIMVKTGLKFQLRYSLAV